MDRYGWLKYMNQFYNICVASPVNNQISFFDGHVIHFNDRVLMHVDHQKIQPSALKANNYGNYQINDNGLNYKPKSH